MLLHVGRRLLKLFGTFNHASRNITEYLAIFGKQNVDIHYNMVHMEVKSLRPKQIQRLRNKHGVRVMKGSGFSVDVSDANAKKLKKAFDNKKGVTLQLSAEEVEANKGMEGSGLFSGLKKVGKSVSKAVTKNPIVKAVEKDVSGAVKQVKKGVSSPEGFKNLVIDAAVGAVPYAGDNTKSALKKSAKKGTSISKAKTSTQKGKGLQSFMKKTGRSVGKVGKQISSVAKKAPVAKVLNKVAQAGLEAGTDALIAGATATNPALGALATPALKSLQNEASKEIDDAFKKKNEQSNRGSLASRASRATTSAMKNAVPELRNIATDMLVKELEERIGSVIGTDIQFGNGIRLQGSGLKLSNQYGKGIMLGTSLIGRDGAGLGHPSLYRSHYNHYPQQQYNI